MKQILSLLLAMVMAAALFTGCACSANVSTDPNGMITEEPTTRPTVMPTPTATHETTRPTAPSLPHATMPTATGSEPTGESTAPTESTMMPRHRNRNIER
jgi:hypothetical protein